MIAPAAAASPAAAAEYWVSTAGNDADDGLTPATAWATLGHAADQVAAGDTVRVEPGGYAGFYLDTSGTPGNPIAFVAEGAGVEIVSDNPLTPDGINLEGADHVVIDGFEVYGRTRAGIRAVLADFVTVRNCIVGDNGRWGIFTGFTDDLLVEANETYGSVDEHGIYVSNSCDRPVVRGNHIHDNYANGIHMNGDAGQGGDGLITDALVEANVIHGNGTGGGSGINGDGLTTSIVRNNLIYDNHASGISLYRIDASAGAQGNVVVNNTIVNASDGRWCVNVNNGSTGNTVSNNILYNHHSFRGAITIDASSRSGFSADFNAVIDRFSIDGGNSVIDLSAWQLEGYGASSFVATPAELFVAPGADFHLLASGPAIDAGTSINAPGDDLDGNPRPIGAGVDLGAYEAQLVTCGDGMVDAGEQCGEPGLTCMDPCTSCSQCTCAADAPTCGDALVCASEECEQDGDCTGGQTCQGCQCLNPVVCTSGLAIDRPRLKLRSGSFRMRLKGEASIPEPWMGVDPPSAGIRVVIDHPELAGGLDVSIPGGGVWKTNAAATRWLYKDKAGAVGGITKALVKDRRAKASGLLTLALSARNGPGSLPPSDAVRTTVVLGGALECAVVEWNGPGGARPRCDGDASKLSCR